MGAIYLNGIPYAGGGGGSGASSYDDLSNKPEINGVELKDDMTTEDLNLVDNETLEVEDNQIKIKNLPKLEGDTLILTFTS